MNKILTARIFSFFVIFSMLFSALGMPVLHARAAGSVTADMTLGSTPTVEGSADTAVFANNSSSISFSHTTGSGNSRMLVVGISTSSSTVTITSVKFGTLTLSSAGTNTGTNRRSAIYYYANPPASTTASIAIVFSGAVYGVASAINVSGVDECTSPTYTGSSGSATPATVNATSVSGDLVFDTVAVGNSTLSVGDGRSIKWNEIDGTTLRGGASTKTATTTSTTMSWTLGTSGAWAISAISIKPSNPINRTNTATSGTTVSITCQDTGTGSNRLMLVGIALNANTTSTSISSVTFTPTNGTAVNLSPVKYEANPWVYRYSGLYYLLPDAVGVEKGQGGNLTVTVSATISSGTIVIGTANFSNVDQTTPLGLPRGNDGVTGTSSVSLIGMAGNELAFENVMIGGTSTTGTVQSGQTQIWNVGGTNARGAGNYKQTSGSTITLTSQTVSSGVAIWAEAGVPILPNCTGGRHTLTIDSSPANTGVTLYPSGGSYCDGSVVTLMPYTTDPTNIAFNSWSGANVGDLTNVSNGIYTIIMNADKSLTPVFNTSTCQYANATLVADTYMNGASQSTNYATATSLYVAGTTTAANERSALLKWDLSSIPGNATIDSGRIVLNLTGANTTTTNGYPLYELGKAWTETGATWASYISGGSWQTGGAAATTGAIDRGIFNLWTATGSSFTSTGSVTINLSSDGVNALKRWFAGNPNNGVSILDYTANTSSTQVIFDSKEGTTPPQLQVHYCLGANPTYTVHFDANGGSGSMSDQSANTPTALTLNAFSRTGYAFNGWNTASDGTGTAYVDGATYNFTANTTLYAQWAVANHTVTFIANGGSGSMSPQINNLPVALTANSFTLTGYKFTGWNTQADGGGTSYADRATYSFAADATLYAQWALAYTVAYDGNGSTGGTVPVDSSSPYSAGATVTVLGNTGALVKTGYGFSGWNTSDDGSGTPYIVGNTFTMPSANVTLYAQWALAYTVIYDGNGSTGGTVPVDSSSPYITGATVTVLGQGSLVKTGYSFSGWNTDSGGGGSSYITGNTFAMGSANVTLYAQWTINSYTVTYNGNSNTGGTAPTDPSSPYTYNSTVTVLDNTGGLVRTGYVFAGWNTAANGSGTSYNPSDIFSIAANTTLYAKWTATYTVTYNGNGSTGGTAPTDPSSPYVSGSTVTVLGNTGDLVKTSYYFNGWNTAANGSGTSYSASATFVIGANTTLYAQWTALPTYTVTFNANGGSSSMSAQVSAVSAPLNTNTFTWLGYAFTGWNSSADGTGTAYADGATYDFSANITLYAQWTSVPTHTLTMATSGGGTSTVTPAAGDHQYNEGSVVNISASAATGYHFVNWTGDVADPNAASTTVTMTTDKTVTANFAQDEYSLTINVTGSGHVNKSPDQLTYHLNDVVQLTAVGDSGYGLYAWGGDLTGSTNPGSVTITGNKTVTATFSRVWVDGTVPAAQAFTSFSSNAVTFTNAPTGSETSNKLMMVGIAWNSGTTATSISTVQYIPPSGPTIDCVQVSLAAYTTTNYRYSALYKCLNTVGGETTGSVKVTYTAATFTTGVVVGVINFGGVDQLNPLGTPATPYTTGSNTATSLSFSGLNGDETLLDDLFVGGNPPQDPSVPSGQTGRWDGTGGNSRGIGSTKLASGSSTTMDWSVTTATYLEQVGVPVNPTYMYSLKAHAFYDENTNTTQDTGEPDLNGWEMKLYTGSGCSGTAVQTVTTSGSGDASFGSIEHGAYSIQETLQTNWMTSSSGGACQNVTLSADNTVVSFGNYEEEVRGLSDTYGTPHTILFPDPDGDGLPNTYNGTPAIWLGSAVAPASGASGGLTTYGSGGGGGGGVEMVGTWIEGTVADGKGGSITVHLSSSSSGSNSGYLKVWFDWDHSGTFDSGEAVVDPMLTWEGTGGTETYTFDIPTGGLSGDLNYQARLFDSITPPADPLSGTYTNGEVEDYQINPTAVELKSFTATGAIKSILLSWETTNEIDNVGFNLYSATAINGVRTRLNTELIPTLQAPGSNIGARYTFTDMNVKDNTTYYYWLEDVDIHGKTGLHGPVPASPSPTVAFVLKPFTATGAKKSILLNWGTASEIARSGFTLYRATSINGKRTRLNAKLIQTLLGSSGTTYSFTDTTVKANRTYYYWLVEVDTSGKTVLQGPVAATSR